MIAVNVLAVTVKLLGAFDGTERFQIAAKTRNQNELCAWNEIEEM